MKKAYIFPILVIFIATSVQIGSGASPVYREFRSEAGGFSVETPVALQPFAFAEQAGQYRVLFHMFLRDLGDRTYTVSYVDYPKEFLQRGPQQLLDMAVEGALARTRSKGVRTKIVSETPLALDVYPGREIVTGFTLAGGKRGRSMWHLFLVNNRLYMLMVIANRGATTDSEMDKFLGSFRLLSR